MKSLKLIFLLPLIIVSCSKTPQEGKTVKNDTAQPASATSAEAVAPAPTPIPPEKMLSPLDSIKELDQKIESYKTGSNLTQADQEKNAQLKQEIIRGTFDLYELCRLALSSHWDTLTTDQQKHFVDLMTRLLERKAIFSKEQVKGEAKPYQVSYTGEKSLNADNTKSKVSTRISVPSEKVELSINYELTKTPYGWKIYDVIVDEASLVENYKFQFDTIIKKYGYPDLISRMEKKLNQME